MNKSRSVKRKRWILFFIFSLLMTGLTATVCFQHEVQVFAAGTSSSAQGSVSQNASVNTAGSTSGNASKSATGNASGNASKSTTGNASGNASKSTTGNASGDTSTGSMKNMDGKHYNIVLVVDGSGSLIGDQGTDQSGYRYNALELFTGVLANEGNKVGAIVFNDGLALDTGLLDMNSMSDKRTLMKQIRNTKVERDTDIGLALQKALEELQSGEADDDLPGCIVLFSDGETDLNSDSAMKASLEKKKEAIAKAQDLGIPIHGICLNTNDSADTEEIKEVANETGGQYMEIKSADDLDDTFLKFYSLIYGETVKGLDSDDADYGEIGDNGYLDRTFKIPTSGVMEVNILVKSSGDTKKMTLVKPDGTKVSSKEMKDMCLSTGDCEVIKVVNPDPGEWTLRVTGDKGTEVRFGWVFNTSIAASLKYLVDGTDVLEDTSDIESSEAIPLKSNIKFEGYFMEDGKRMEDISNYQEYTATLVLLNQDTNKETYYDMTPEGDHYESQMKGAQAGNYQASLRLTYGNVEYNSRQVSFTVSNNAVATKKSSRYTFIGIIVCLVILALGAGVMIYVAGQTFWICTWTITVESFNEKTGERTNPWSIPGIESKKSIKEWYVGDCEMNGSFRVLPGNRKNRNSRGKIGRLCYESSEPFYLSDGTPETRLMLMLGDDIYLYSSKDRMSGIRIIITDNLNWDM